MVPLLLQLNKKAELYCTLIKFVYNFFTDVSDEHLSCSDINLLKLMQNYLVNAAKAWLTSLSTAITLDLLVFCCINFILRCQADNLNLPSLIFAENSRNLQTT